MKRNFIKAVALTTALSAVTLPSYGFDLLGWFKKDNSIEKMLEYIPQDTAIFFGSISNKEIVTSADQLMANANLQTAANDLTQMMGEYAETDRGAFSSWLITDYYANASSGGEHLYKHYGIDPSGASVFYLDGIYPVIRVAVTNEDAFLDILKKGAAESDFEITTSQISGETVNIISLVDEDDLQISLGVRVKNKVLTLAIYSQHDNDADQTQRFALKKPEAALSKDAWKKDGKTYGFDKNLRGYFNFVNIAKAILQPDSKANQQLALFTDTSLSQFESLDTQCRAEIIDLVSNSPRAVFGSTRYDIDDDQIAMDFKYVLEINHAGINGELKKLTGFIPSYVYNDKNLITGFGLGLDIDNLTPVLSELWKLFTQAEYSCDSLQSLQELAVNYNPAVLGMFTGMAQGLKGFSIGLYDLILDEQNPTDFNIDFVATITADKPEVIAALLTTSIPALKGTHIATDGTPTILNSELLPFEANAAILGKNLVLYSGKQGKATAMALGKEAVEPNGLSAFHLDYQKAGNLALQSVETLAQFQAGTGSETECVSMYSAALMLQTLPVTLSAKDSIDDRGLTSHWSMTMDPSQIPTAGTDITGDFKLEYLEDDCAWEPIGQETIQSDGSGIYFERDETDSCNLYESHYQWDKKLTSLSQHNSTNKSRESCDEAWVDDEPYDFNCQIMNSTDDGFYCLETEDGEQSLYRYSRQ